MQCTEVTKSTYLTEVRRGVYWPLEIEAKAEKQTRNIEANRW